MKSYKYFIFCISIIKLPKMFTTVEENMIFIKNPEVFCFNFNLPKDVDGNFKHELEFIIRSNKSLS